MTEFFTDKTLLWKIHDIRTVFGLELTRSLAFRFPQRKIPWFHFRVIEKYYTPGSTFRNDHDWNWGAKRYRKYELYRLVYFELDVPSCGTRLRKSGLSDVGEYKNVEIFHWKICCWLQWSRIYKCWFQSSMQKSVTHIPMFFTTDGNSKSCFIDVIDIVKIMSPTSRNVPDIYWRCTTSFCVVSVIT